MTVLLLSSAHETSLEVFNPGEFSLDDPLGDLTSLIFHLRGKNVAFLIILKLHPPVAIGKVMLIKGLDHTLFQLASRGLQQGINGASQEHRHFAIVNIPN
jgi:hypothetical protein